MSSFVVQYAEGCSGADPGFQDREGGGAHLKKLRRAEGCTNILRQKIIFPPRIRPWCFPTIKLFNTETHSCLKDRNNNKGQRTFEDISFEGHVTIDIGTDIFICFAIQQ